MTATADQTATTPAEHEDCDGRCEVRLSGDQVEARVTLIPPKGRGRAVREIDVVKALATLGVRIGIRRERVLAALALGDVQDFVVAAGRAPIHGDDGRLEYLVEPPRSREPQLGEDGLIDYRDLGDIHVVTAGAELMRLHPASEGHPGATVMGVPIMPKPGRPPAFPKRLEGAAPAADNPDVLVATITGQPVMGQDRLVIEPTLVVDQVDLATGNIRFDGSVIVKGDVHDGMTVMASGDIQVDGMCEPCILEAGGNIVVKGGVIGNAGRSGEVESHIHCQGSFSAGFAQQAHIDAGDSVFIDDMVMQSHIVAGHHIVVGQKRRGQVIGGSLEATLSITAKVIGSPNRIKTRIEMGVSPEIHKQCALLAMEQDAREDRLIKASKLLDQILKKPGSQPPEVVAACRKEIAVLCDEIGELRRQQELLDLQIELANQARVIAQSKLHDGVIVSFGSRRYEVHGDHGPSSIQLEGKVITHTPYRR